MRMMLGPGDADFPSRLAALADPPVRLEVLGDPAVLSRPSVAVVGSRSPSADGLAAAAALAEAAADRGLVVVSGLAPGCDTAAHAAAVAAGTPTVAVLPGGLDALEPGADADLAGRIVRDGGALITEYEPDDPPSPDRRLARDRLQSGLALGVVVAETESGGGAMHTARCAAAQGRALAVVLSTADGSRALLTGGATGLDLADAATWMTALSRG